MLRTASSGDGGTSWSATTTIAAGGRISGVQLASADDGTTFAVWQHEGASGTTIFASSSNPSGTQWSAPVALTAPGNHNLPTLALQADNTVVAAWSAVANAPVLRTIAPSLTTIQSSSSRDGGATWSAPLDVSTDGVANSPQLVSAANGTTTAVWASDDEGAVSLKSSSTVDGGTTWSMPAHVSDDVTDPSLALSANGAIVAAWKGTGSTTGLLASSSVDSGATWSPVGTITADPAANSGELTLVASSAPAGFAALWLGSEGGQRHVRSAHSVDGGASWSAATTVASARNFSGPTLAADEAGTLSAAWRDAAGLQFSRSLDQGANWSTPVGPFAPRGSVSPTLVPAHDGTVAAVWLRDTVDETTSHVESSVLGESASVTSAAPPAATRGVAYSFQLTAGGAGAATFAVTAGALPSGVTLNAATGLLSGTPSSAGPASFTVTASNRFGGAASPAYAVDVAPGTSTPSPDGGITPVFEGKITLDRSQVPASGGQVVVNVPQATPGQLVAVWLHSTPTSLGWHTVSAARTVTVIVPNNIPAGAHRVVVHDAADAIIGWSALTVSAAATPTPTPAASSPTSANAGKLASTGVDGLAVGSIGALLLALGACTLVVRRRKMAVAE